MVFAKISVGLFLLRVTVQTHYRRIIYGVMFATVITGLVFFFISVLQCTPVWYFWDKYHTTGTCVNIDVIIGIAFIYSAIASICEYLKTASQFKYFPCLESEHGEEPKGHADSYSEHGLRVS